MNGYDYSWKFMLPPRCKEKIWCLVGRISGAAYASAVRHSLMTNSNRANSKNENDYNSGNLNSDEDPNLVERLGKFGEMLLGEFFGVPIDHAFRQGGDGGFDFVLMGLKTDVKVSSGTYHGKVFFYATTKGGFKIKRKAHIYIPSYLLIEDRVVGFAEIVYVGWNKREWFVTQTQVKSPLKDSVHLNYDMYFHDTHDLRRLVGYWQKNYPAHYPAPGAAGQRLVIPEWDISAGHLRDGECALF